jgi:hypothetical protein
LIQSYNGISRAGEKTEAADFSTLQKEKRINLKQAIGEALFMRAYFYFRLASFRRSSSYYKN